MQQIKSGDYVVIVYSDKEYPGKVVTFAEDGADVDYMENGKKFWKRLKIPDAILFNL